MENLSPSLLPHNIIGHNGHLEYTGDVPTLITAPEEALHGMSGHGIAPPSGQWSMLRRRLKLFHLTVPIPEPRHAIVPCTSCFAVFVTEKAREWRASQA